MNEDAPDNQALREKGLLERIGLAFANEPRDIHDVHEVLRSANDRKLIDPDSMSMIDGVFEIEGMRVRDVMVPRAQMVCVNNDMPFEDIIDVIIESGHSRFPVIGESRDEVVGMLLAKDFLRFIGNESSEHFCIDDLMRPAVITPDGKSLNVLLREFRTRRNHMFIAQDEYGGIAGLVTLEDVLELIVGEIEDEYDEEDETNIRREGADRYIVRALTPIEEFNESLGTHLSDGEFDTIGGLVMQKLGRVPVKGEVAELNGFQFKVVLSDNRRLHLLEVRPVA